MFALVEDLYVQVGQTVDRKNVREWKKRWRLEITKGGDVGASLLICLIQDGQVRHGGGQGVLIWVSKAHVCAHW